MRYSIGLRSVAALSATLLFCGTAAAAANTDDNDRVAQPQLTTVAGSGLRGRDDGAAADATFLTPAGVAVANDGTIYVADAAAHDVRRVHDGQVDTYAGTSDSGNAPENREGGFGDGPAVNARFNRPVSLALAGDGTLYVADAGNHCIRKIAHGLVSTFSGSRRDGHDDGNARVATYGNLKGIALADDGTLYVADDGAGIRHVARDGSVKTTALPSERKTALGVAARTVEGHALVAYTDAAGIYLSSDGGKPQSLAFDEEREPEGGGVAAGRAYGIAIVNENTVVVSDVAAHALRLVRFPAPPFVAGHVVRALAGGMREGSDVAGGFADGPPWRSKLDTPAAVALAPDGTIVVADAGNRRIRRLVNLDARESVLPDLTNFAIPADSYHIAVVGNSYAFYNVLWPESIGGRIEAGLGRDAKTIGLKSRVAVTTFRLDAASDDAAISVIHEYLYDHRTRLIVLLLNAYTGMRSDTLERLQAQLDSVNIKLLAVYTPQGFEVSPRDFWNGKRDQDEPDAVALRADAAHTEAYYAMVHVHGLYLLDAMEAQDAARDREPLFYASEHHLTVYGSEWVGRRIVEELERWRPWQRR